MKKIKVYYQHEETGLIFEKTYSLDENIEQFPRRQIYKVEYIEVN